jgi:hypothetical protein
LSVIFLFSTGSSDKLQPRPQPRRRTGLGVAQKVSRRGEPLFHFGVSQAVEQHLHGLVDSPPKLQVVGSQRYALSSEFKRDIRAALFVRIAEGGIVGA